MGSLDQAEQAFHDTLEALPASVEQHDGTQCGSIIPSAEHDGVDFH
jgi:hypothetical protein